MKFPQTSPKSALDLTRDERYIYLSYRVNRDRLPICGSSFGVKYDQQSQTDEEILDIAARLLLSDDGGDKLTMNRLAEQTGVSRATLYRRFGSREVLLQRLAEEREVAVAELERLDIRTRILDAARRVFGQTGWLGETVEAIAQEAEVGPATVYRHFGSKEGLMDAFRRSIRPRLLIQVLVTAETEDFEVLGPFRG